jgi:2-phosphoglycerate kinase
MTTVELKNNFHHLIDSIDNESLLMKFYDLLLRKKDPRDGRLLNYLTKEEQEELYLAEEESENSYNVVSNEEQKKKHKKWLSK